MGYMVGNFAIIAMRRAMIESRRTKNLKESIRKRNINVGEVRGLLMKRAWNTAVWARRTRRQVNAIVYIRPQTNGHHQRRTAPKALRAAPKALKALQGDSPGPRNREMRKGVEA